MIWFWVLAIYALIGVAFLFWTLPQALGTFLGALLVLATWPAWLGGRLGEAFEARRRG